MIKLDYSQIFPLAYLILYLAGFFYPLIVLKIRGVDTRGTLEGVTRWNPFAKVIALISGLWVPMVILYAIKAESISWFLIIPFLDNDFVKVAGIIIAGISLPIILIGMVALGGNFRILLPREKTELVTNGIYHYVRNPLVLSIYIIAFGIFLIVPNLLMLASFICSIFNFEAKIREEDKFLLKLHKEAYKKYKNNTGKYFPKMKWIHNED